MTKAGAKLPYEDTKIASFMRERIQQLSRLKSQREIAAQMGYDRPNVISMFKRGEAKVPLERIPAMAKALEVDPKYLFRIAFQSYLPDQEALIGDLFGGIVTKNNSDWIAAIEEGTGEADPELTSDRRQKLLGLLSAK